MCQNIRKEVPTLQGRIKELNTNLEDTYTDQKAEEGAPPTNNDNKEAPESRIFGLRLSQSGLGNQTAKQPKFIPPIISTVPPMH
jgi:hypothetical protein